VSEENKEIVRRIEEAWNNQDLDALDELFAPEFDNRATGTPGLPPGLAGAKMAHGMAMQSFPDRKVTIEDIVAEGDRVAVRARVTGTNTGGFPAFHVPPNDARIDIGFISIYQLREGKVVRHWGLNDTAALMQQLGAVQ
jgi:predicted ester cyclase